MHSPKDCSTHSRIKAEHPDRLAHHQHVTVCAPDNLGANRSEQRAAISAPDHKQVGSKLVRFLDQLLGGLSARLGRPRSQSGRTR
jgi:hypothetical protein